MARNDGTAPAKKNPTSTSAKKRKHLYPELLAVLDSWMVFLSGTSERSDRKGLASDVVEALKDDGWRIVKLRHFKNEHGVAAHTIQEEL